MQLFETRDEFLDNYVTKNPGYSDWGRETLYSTLVARQPDIQERIKEPAEPKYRSLGEMLGGYREAFPDYYGGLSDQQALFEMERAQPGLMAAWKGVAPDDDIQPVDPEAARAAAEELTKETEADRFTRMFGEWYGPLPTKPLEEYEQGEDLLEVGKRNLEGTAGFLEGLAGKRATDWVPWVGEIAGTVLDIGDVLKIGDKMKKNPESVTEEEAIRFNH